MSLKFLLVSVLFATFTAAVPLDEIFSKNIPQLKLEDEIESTYRLPNDSIPIRYDLWLQTNIDQGIFSFNGRVKIQIKVIEPTQLITLHYRQIDIGRVDMLSVSNNLISSELTFALDDQHEFLRIYLPQAVARNAEFVLDIAYNGTLRFLVEGFFYTSYTNAAGGTSFVAATNFKPTDARHAMPCYDEPGFRTIIGLEIQHVSSYKALSNMPEVSRTPVSGTNDVTTKFEDTSSMQTYLLGFIVSDYDYTSNNEVDIPQRVFAKTQAIVNGDGDFAASIVGPILNKFVDLLNIPFPLPKMDHVAIFAYDPVWLISPAENPGMIIYSENDILYDKSRSLRLASFDFEKTLIQFVAQQFAHQWFGHIVNPSWWSDVWLNEGFSKFFEYYVPSLLYADDGYMESFEEMINDITYLVENPKWKSEALSVYVESPKEVLTKIYSIPAYKGATVMRMFMEALSTPTFMKGLYYYMAENIYRSVTPEVLHRALKRSYDEDNAGNLVDLDAVMKTWENQAGYPTIHVTKTGNNFQLTQTRIGGEGEIYSIPISYATKSEMYFEAKTAKLWMTQRTATISSIIDSWILINIGLTGYYKVTYESSIMISIINMLKDNYAKVSTNNRKEILTVTLTMMEDETIAIYRGLDLVSFIEKEDQLVVWKQFKEVDSFYRNKLFGTEVLSKYEEFLHSVVQPQINRLGFEKIEGEKSTDTYFRDLVKEISCRSNHQECLTDALNKLTANIEAGEETPDICESVKLADETVFYGIINNILTVPSFENRFYHLTQLGCSLNENFIRNFLELVLDEANNLNTWERWYIIYSTKEKSLLAFESVLDFLTEKFDSIATILGSNFDSIFTSMSYLINTERHSIKFLWALEKVQRLELLSESEFVAVSNRVTANLSWQQKYSRSIESWLNGEVPEEPATDPPENESSTTIETTTVIQTTTASAGSMIAQLAVVVACISMKIIL